MNILSLIFTNPMVAFILLVGVIVFVHEMGHFLMGRLMGVDVEEFSLGFGPRAVGFKRGITDYRICWLPLGGYVRFFGAELGKEIPVELLEKSITTCKLYKRALISAAGPLANFVLSFVVMVVLSQIGLPHQAPILSMVSGSVAEQAGLKSGDRVLSIDGAAVATWQDLNRIVTQSAGKALVFKVDRNNQSVDVTVTPRLDASQSPFGDTIKVGRIGVTPYQSDSILVVNPQGVLFAAGLQTGDKILAIDSKPVKSIYAVEAAVGAFLNNTLDEEVFLKSGAQLSQKSVQFEVQRSGVANAEALEKLFSRKVQKNPEFKNNDDVEKIETIKITLDASLPAILAWKELTAKKLSGGVTLESPRALVSTDLMVKDFENLKRGDKKISTVEELKNCGLKSGDTIVKINQKSVAASPADLGMALENIQSLLAPETKNLNLALTIIGFKDSVRQLNCKLPVRVGKDAFNRPQMQFDFPLSFVTHGLPPESVIVKSSSVLQAFSDGATASFEQATSIFNGIRKLVTGSIPLSNLGGPIAIARVAGDAAQGGFIVFALTISWMSINIGMLNLLPLPVFDGGTLLMQGVEAAYGKPLPLGVQQKVQTVGVVIIMLLFVVVFYNDILRLFNS